MNSKKKNIRKTMVFGIIAVLCAGLLSACSAGSGGGASGGGSNEPSGTASGPGGKPKEKVTVNIGVQGNTGILYYARETKAFDKAFAEAGAEVKWYEFASGPPHFEALASGRLDFGSVGGTPVISGQTGGVDFKAIAVTGDGKKSNAIVLPKNSAIKDMKDLKGKKIAVAKGSSAYNFLYRVLEKAGLTDKDVQIIQLQPDEARPALDTGAIDAWSVWEPYVTTAVVQSGDLVLVTGQDLNIFAPGFLIARTKFTEEHPDLTVLFLKEYEKVREYYASHLEEVADMLSKTNKLDKNIVLQVLQKSEPLLSPITPEFAKVHQEQADFLYSVGAINKKLDTSQVLDSRFVDQALKELKEGK
ncbi:aliphatic sulfonate ABC transporter substrate-binding protein [Paenibacillus humicola]|uniref:aliphatic sulfonate ABC transporter substrate-binding protein n=1 Tax=Paenibacillus humicola TaxID=3110540 RepID=UPI00237BC876|nr:aliphatic sulfonate ABC transporter substrate-binding protein [Paenibacillus humicola]